MSHPWMPQPYYATRQSRLTAPVPQPMGLGSLGGRNDYYTAGIFDERVDMPAYMYERTGVHGLGADAQACVTPGEAAEIVVGLVRQVANLVPVPGAQEVIGWATDLIGTRQEVKVTLGDVMGPFEGKLKSLVASGAQDGAREWARGRDAVIYWIAGKLSEASGIDRGVLNKGLQAAAGATFDKLINLNICFGESQTYSEVLLAQPQPTTGVNWMTVAKVAQQPQPTAAELFLRLTPEQRATAQAALTAQRAAAGRTAMLVGAAAIAALLLLR